MDIFIEIFNKNVNILFIKTCKIDLIYYKERYMCEFRGY